MVVDEEKESLGKGDDLGSHHFRGSHANPVFVFTAPQGSCGQPLSYSWNNPPVKTGH